MLGPQLPPESWLPAHLEVPLETGPRSACNQQLVAGAISPLQTNLSSYKCSKMRTVLTLQSRKLVHVSGLHFLWVRPLQGAVPLRALLYRGQ